MDTSSHKIIFVDDDLHYSNLLIRSLKKVIPEEIDILAFSGAIEAEIFIQENAKSISVIVVDYRMPEMDGLEFIKKIQNYKNHFQIIVITGSVDAKLASLIPNYSIFDLIEKDTSPKKIVSIIEKAYELFHHHLNKENKIQAISNRLYINPDLKKQ